MSTRSQPMATAGHSFEADTLADDETRSKVEVVILDILKRIFYATDDTISAVYSARAENYPGVPKVTPQRIRTARANLTRRGILIDSGQPGTSALGNPATVWTLNPNRGDR
ncbi:hypothetical protein [Microbacterium sp. YY-01]|uniref:hypothetical protein n=1 Tax=Microbacterium sp. YY-01 TaxID=3421634 RepID=UPI003D17C82B